MCLLILGEGFSEEHTAGGVSNAPGLSSSIEFKSCSMANGSGDKQTKLAATNHSVLPHH